MNVCWADRLGGIGVEGGVILTSLFSSIMAADCLTH